MRAEPGIQGLVRRVVDSGLVEAVDHHVPLVNPEQGVLPESAVRRGCELLQDSFQVDQDLAGDRRIEASAIVSKRHPQSGFAEHKQGHRKTVLLKQPQVATGPLWTDLAKRPVQIVMVVHDDRVKELRSGCKLTPALDG